MAKAERPIFLLTPLGTWVLEGLVFVGECAILLGQCAARLFRRPFEWQETLNQMSFVGAASVPIVALTCFSSGAVVALYSADVLVDYGATRLAGGTVALAVTRELAPVLAGIMVAARAGSAMAAQIGSMKVTEQIDALRALNVHPVQYLALPRLIACLLMLPILCVVGDYAGVIGGYLVATLNAGVPHGAFIASIRQFVEPSDITGGMIKTLVFGLIVAIVACQQGLRTKDGAVGVGRTTTSTVVLTMVLIYIANFALTWVLFK